MSSGSGSCLCALARAELAAAASLLTSGGGGCPRLASPQCADNIPPGYEPISLLEALNGLRSVSPSIPSAPLYDEISYSGVLDGLPPPSRPLVGLDRGPESSHQKGKRSKSPDRWAVEGQPMDPPPTSFGVAGRLAFPLRATLGLAFAAPAALPAGRAGPWPRQP